MPKGKFDTPGPFFHVNGLIRRMVDGRPDRPFNAEEAEDMVALLNKGTHFDGMLAALNWADVMLDKLGHVNAGPGPCRKAVRAAIAKAEGNADV